MWETVRLGDVCGFQNGRAFRKSEWAEDGLPIVRIQNLQDRKTAFNYFAGNYESKIFIEEGDLLLGWSGTIRPFIWNSGPALINQHVFKVDTSNDVSTKFIFYSLTEATKRLSGGMVGIGLKHITKKTLNQTKILLPPLAEQKRIVERLDKAFSEIEKATATAEAKEGEIDRLKAAIVSSLVARDEQRMARLGDVLSIARGGSPRPIKLFITEDADGINWIKIGDAAEGGKYIENTGQKIKPSGISRSRYVQSGDFLLSNSMSFGRPYILKTNGCIHDGWLVLSDYEETFEAEYLYYLLSSTVVQNQFEMLARGSTVRNLNTDLVSRVTVNVPSLADQRGIIERLDKAFAAIEIVSAKTQSCLGNYSALKAAILKEELTPSEAV